MCFFLQGFFLNNLQDCLFCCISDWIVFEGVEKFYIGVKGFCYSWGVDYCFDWEFIIYRFVQYYDIWDYVLQFKCLECFVGFVEVGLYFIYNV